MSVLRREAVYLWYYFDIQVRQIIWYWLLGMVIGSLVSVFGKGRIHRLFEKMGDARIGKAGVVPAAVLGILSPLCMYGTIPIAASFAEKGMRQDWLASFMMASVLLNPQLIIYSTALGSTVLFVRIVSCFFCGITAGLVVHFAYKDRPFFNFSGFAAPEDRDTAPDLVVRFFANLWRNVKATGVHFLLGIVLSVLFQRYVPSDAFASLFGAQNRGFGLLMAATIGVPLYACGGGTIPLLQTWLWDGMSVGAAASFMITGPATKITNLGALKIVLGKRRFLMYIAFVMIFAFLSGALTDLLK